VSDQAGVSDQATKARRFLELHQPGKPLLMPNAWDVGSARLLASLGFEALATTSSGHAATLGLLDGAVGRDAALAYSAQLVAATELPVSADLENGFGHDPEQVATTVRLAAETGLAGCSIEDFTGDRDNPIYDLDLAVERVDAAAREAHDGPMRLVLTARAENHLHGRDDLADTIARLRSYQEAGADVLFAPGLGEREQIQAVVDAVYRPVSVLAWPGTPPVAELARLGVSRISVGGAFAFAALDALMEAASELRGEGTYGYLQRSRRGVEAARRTFGRG
jgi:2-methylisocitrate lyase-like PEP mutase family enzyme